MASTIAEKAYAEVNASELSQYIDLLRAKLIWVETQLEADNNAEPGLALRFVAVGDLVSLKNDIQSEIDAAMNKFIEAETETQRSIIADVRASIDFRYTGRGQVAEDEDEEMPF